MSEKKRDPFFDVVKALAITLVVFGHIVGLADHRLLPIEFDNFRIGVNMPIFFLIAGYFAWSTIERHDWRKLLKAIGSYFVPALFFCVLFLKTNIIKGVFVDPWFITTLALCYVLTFVAYFVGRSLPFMLSFLALAMLGVLFRPSFISAQITFSCIINMLPLFMAGCVFRMLDLKPWESRKLSIAGFLVFVIFVSTEGDVNTNGMSFYTADSTYHAFAMGYGYGMAFFLRPLIGLVGSIGVMGLVKMVLAYAPRLAIISKLGTMTLGIYLFHLQPIEWLRGYPQVASNIFTVIATTFILLAISALVTYVLTQKIGRFKIFIWGRR